MSHEISNNIILFDLIIDGVVENEVLLHLSLFCMTKMEGPIRPHDVMVGLNLEFMRTHTKLTKRDPGAFI
jgi:hypothetical protein